MRRPGDVTVHRRLRRRVLRRRVPARGVCRLPPLTRPRRMPMPVPRPTAPVRATRLSRPPLSSTLWSSCAYASLPLGVSRRGRADDLPCPALRPLACSPPHRAGRRTSSGSRGRSLTLSSSPSASFLSLPLKSAGRHKGDGEEARQPPCCAASRAPPYMHAHSRAQAGRPGATGAHLPHLSARFRAAQAEKSGAAQGGSKVQRSAAACVLKRVTLRPRRFITPARSAPPHRRFQRTSAASDRAALTST